MGERIEEPYLQQVKRGGESRWTDDFVVLYEIPPRHYFVLGDNRPSSFDSREMGPIHHDQIIGRVSGVIWPFQRWSNVSISSWQP